MVTIMIDTVRTGENIYRLMTAKGLKVRDLQREFGFERPSGIYKWVNGKGLPSVDNLVILAHILDVSMDDIVVIKARDEEDD